MLLAAVHVLLAAVHGLLAAVHGLLPAVCRYYSVWVNYYWFPPGVKMGLLPAV